MDWMLLYWLVLLIININLLIASFGHVARGIRSGWWGVLICIPMVVLTGMGLLRHLSTLCACG